MKNFILLGLTILTACGGTLTDEQRKKARESIEQGQLRRVTDSELTEASFALGRTITELIEKRDRDLANRVFLDSLQNVYNVEIISMKPGDSTSRAVEQQIIEAYIAGTGQVKLSDNIQKLGKDSILYTKPILKDRPDGSVEFTKALGIRMAKKEIVLSIKDWFLFKPHTNIDSIECQLPKTYVPYVVKIFYCKFRYVKVN